MGLKKAYKDIGIEIVLLCILRNYMQRGLFFALCVVYFIFLIFSSGMIKNWKIKIPKRGTGLIFLFIMLWIGFIVGLMHVSEYNIYAIIRDCYYVTQPIIFLLIGMAYYYKYKDSKNIWKTIVIATLIIDIYYLFSMASNFNIMIDNNVNAFRESVGKEYVISTFGLFILIANKNMFSKKIRLNLVFLFSLVFLFQFSRGCLGMFGIEIIVYLVVGKKIRFKWESIMSIFGTIILVVILLNIIPNNLLDNYYNKIMRSTTEINTGLDYWSYDTISQNYRGYETMRALTTYKEGAIYDMVFGYGFGKYVDLNFAINLGGEVMSSVPTFHNGYMFILIKLGIVGMFLYFGFFLWNVKVFALNYRRNNSPNDALIMLGIIWGAIFFAYFKGGMIRIDGIFEIPFLIGYYGGYKNNNLIKIS